MERNELSNFGRASPRNMSVKLFLNQAIGLGGDVMKCFFPIFSSCDYFVLRSGTILAIFVEGLPRDISVKLF